MDGTLGGVGGSLDVLGMVIDPGSNLVRGRRRLKQAPRRLSRSDSTNDVPDVATSPDFSKAPVRTNRDVLDNGPGTPMTLDNVHGIAGRMDIDLQDVDVVLGVDHPTPRTQRTGETILVVDRADAEHVTVGWLWTAESQ